MIVTEVEKVLMERGYGNCLNPDMSIEDRQAALDEIAPLVLRVVSPQGLLNHNKKVYDETAKQYANNPHTKDVIDEIITFMDMLPDGACVLDVGCAGGRDACFMVSKDPQYRLDFMNRKDKQGKTTAQKFPVPEKSFTVIGIDTSLEFLCLAQERAGRLGITADAHFFYEDMHDIWIRYDDSGYFTEHFDGVWSCTALFTHTPHALLDSAMKSVARVLKQGGLFFASYTNGLADGRYDRLLASSTGHVKYFSQPDPKEIVRLARQNSLVLQAQSFSDYKDKYHLFVSQFFKKR